jgi:hypothetical protein
MKTQTIRLLAVSGILAALALAAVLHFRPHPAAEESAADPADVQPGWTKHVTTDAAEIFRRAFWRHPAADDRIVHAERIEWSDPATGVAKWQWHLEVEPGPALKKWLAESNPFGLAAAAPQTAGHQRRVPAWWPEALSPEDYDIRGSDTLVFALRRSGDRLYACANGRGFAAPAVAVTK